MDASWIAPVAAAVITAGGVAFFSIGAFRERTSRARENEERMQTELVSVTKTVEVLADVIEKNSWKDGEAHRAIQRSLEDLKHSLERLLDGRR